MENTQIKTLNIETVKVLREARQFIYLSIGIFLAGVFIGMASPVGFERLLDPLMKLAEHLRGRSALIIILTIFIQNSASAFLAVWLGTIMGIVPFFGALINGILLGVVIVFAVQTDPMAILRLIPHGIFEIPAIFMSWGLGLWRGEWLFRRDKNQTYRERARKAYHVFFTFIIPLLIIAAVIEGLSIAFAVSSG